MGVLPPVSAHAGPSTPKIPTLYHKPFWEKEPISAFVRPE